MPNLRRIVALVLSLLMLNGCAHYIGRKIVEPPDQHELLALDPSVAEQLHGQLFSNTARLAMSDGVELQVYWMPPGVYPHRYQLSQNEERFNLRLSMSLSGGPPQDTARGTIVLLHGWQVDHQQLLIFALELGNQGWNSVLVDLRGHGQSGGEHVTFGVHESEDIASVLDWVREQPEFVEPLVVMGTSLGGSVGLMAAARRPVDAVVAVAPFADFGEILPDGLQVMAPGWMGPWLRPARVERALIHAEERAGIRMADAAPILTASEVQAPVLLIHGKGDRIVPKAQSERLADSLPNARLELVDVSQHEVLLIDRDRLFDLALPWLDEVAPARPPVPENAN
ncbi:MAG: alpha/beta hydrolase family protein [Wenzhouxiangella sp.]